MLWAGTLTSDGVQPEAKRLEQLRPLPLLPVAPLLGGWLGGLGWRDNSLGIEVGIRELTPLRRRGPARPMVLSPHALPSGFSKAMEKTT